MPKIIFSVTLNPAQIRFFFKHYNVSLVVEVMSDSRTSVIYSLNTISHEKGNIQIQKQRGFITDKHYFWRMNNE